MAGTIFILFFSTSVEMLLAGNIICGIPWVCHLRLFAAEPEALLTSSLPGYFPNSDNRLCRRNLSRRYARLPDRVGVHVLGLR
jgi:hypothetical protein